MSKAEPKKEAEGVLVDSQDVPTEPAPTPPETVTVRGVEYALAPGARDDFELLDDLVQYQDGDASRTPSILRRLLGDVEAKVVLQSLRDPQKGRVTLEAGKEFVGDLLEALDPN